MFRITSKRLLNRARTTLIPSGTLLAAGTLYYLADTKSTALQTQSDKSSYASQSQLHNGKVGIINPTVFLWGRNAHNVASMDTPEIENIKKPKQVIPFDGAILRDLVLHETYGVAVDSKGDVLQWGLGFGTPSSSNVKDSGASPTVSVAEPHPTLIGKDIMTVAVSNYKVYALSRSGEIFIFPAESDKQGLPGTKSSNNSWLSMGWITGSSKQGSVYEKLKTDVPLARGEKFISISTGSSHLLALTSNYRSFASPLSLTGNAYGQLAVKKCTVISSTPNSTSPDDSELSEQIVTLIPDPHMNDIKKELPPPAKLDPLLLPMNVNTRVPTDISQLSTSSLSINAPTTRPDSLIKLSEDSLVQSALEKSIKFSTTLHEIPSLRSIRITQLVAGDIHSLALTAEGRVLGWGANGYGQLGLGASLAFPSIPTPTEIPLARVYPKATRMACTRIAAGGLSSYFVVETEDIRIGRRSIDLLAAGNGQFGGIGNGSWAHAASPAKVKTISGLQEWSDVEQKVEPIPLKEISVGKNHIAIVLDNAVEQPGGIKFGRDVFVWGQNEFYQLGTGKRSNLSTPQHLPPLPYPGLTTPLPDDLPQSGTLSPMPHNRLQLAPEIKHKGKLVEETIVAGDGGSAVYWRILNP